VDVLTGELNFLRAVNPDDFVAWLTTQTNVNGSLFLSKVAKRYAYNLSSVPPKLDIPLTAEERNVFCCLTINEFDRLCEIFRNAPNYNEINSHSDHGAFSAGLGAYRRYLERLVGQVDSFSPGSHSVSTSVMDDIVDLEEGKDGIRNILRVHFQTLYGYSNINILWNAVQDTLSMFLNDNAINSSDDMWRFMQRAFSGEYVLRFPHIWQSVPDYPQNHAGLIINLVRQHGGVLTREQIDDYFSHIKIGSPTNAVVISQTELLFCGSGKFILTDDVNLNTERCEAIKKTLDSLFASENEAYIVLRDIKSEWFFRLPELPNGIGWSPLLLQEVLRIRPNIGYRVVAPVLSWQKYDKLGVAIVMNNSDIMTFADLVHRYCYTKYKLPHKLTAEELRLELRNTGMVEGNELTYNLHKSLKDYRFAFTDENKMVKILER